MSGEQEQECGYVYDHTVVDDYEDDEVWQGHCSECGAELWHDKTEDDA